ncbi:Protein kinase domain-containing protein [Pseudobutyrivibrio sp. 49]|uniref:serine/threonine protein kinase n=1 Tax=Pseudobutyrivibrio sp. 49 TaxID=1855344 RepID=UPI000887D8EF|nr:protein kinase [Pseudobutyrivibrio sp. 49]SDH71153.1 Protein kinase domain-containing protein [Pseudobutyrivibrio sp. 49]
MIPKGIEDKYEVIRILQQTAATAVLLVRYKPIGALRILKAIHKAHPDAYSILSESNLLQGIKSSQIPTIFEVEDTEEIIYLVEEYVEGISLREYLLETKLTTEKLIYIAVELCKIVETLHTAGSEPVLYRDMKPEHVFMEGDAIRLIDFGISVRKSEANNAKPLGTKGWAAPEQLEGEYLDERCDVYGVGKVIGFMQINSYANDDFKIKQIVDCATEADINKRIGSITELKELLERLQKNRVNDKVGEKHLEKRIAVIGGSPAIGTTRIAISLCQFFNKRKIDCYYRDNEKDTVRRLWMNLKNTKLQQGILYHDNFKGLFEYGEAVEDQNPPKGLYVIDCGTNKNIPMGTDIVIYVTGGAPWQQEDDMPEWIKNDSVYVVTNFTDKISSILLAKTLKKKVYRYPIVKSLDISKDEENVFSAIFKNEKDSITTQQ